MISEHGEHEDISALTARTLSARALFLLEQVAKAARDSGSRTFIVGGSVRDILLGRSHYDLDVAIEGDAVALAGELEREGVGRVVATHKFGTAELDWGGPRHLDLVTARREQYEHPGSLPTVEPGTIFDDLARRDFTINAMAIEVLPGAIGGLLDPHLGVQDLRTGLVRVLHDNSFIDDPTRIFRAVRYAVRLGFQVESHTLELIFRAVRDDALSTVSLGRSVREIMLIMQEPRAGRMLAMLEDYGVLRAVHPDLYWPYPAGSATIPGEEHAMSPEERRDTFLTLLAAEYATEPEEAGSLALSLGLDARASRLMRDTAQLAHIWPQLGEPDLRPSAIYHLLSPLDTRALEAFARIEAMSKDPVPWGRLRDYLARLRFVRPEIGGDYLKQIGVAPGPVYRQVIEALHDALMDEEVTTRAGEEKFVREWLQKGETGG